MHFCPFYDKKIKFNKPIKPCTAGVAPSVA